MIRFFTFLLSLSVVITSNAQDDGSLDIAYGKDGIVLTPPGGLGGESSCSAIQPDDKVIIGGYFADSVGDEVLLWAMLQRYNTDGTVDESFGEKGRVLSHFDSPYNVYGPDWQFVAVQSDGYIIAATELYKRDSRFPFFVSADIVIARFTPDGLPDASFGVNGIVITDLGQSEEVNAMTLQKDGKIVLAGITINSNGSNGPGFIIRYHPDGTLDNTFGDTGSVILLDVGYTGFALAIQPDGRILSGGTFNYSNDVSCLYRNLPDGRLDSSFGTNGSVITRFEETIFTQINSLAVLENGNILAGGIAADEPYTESMAVVRYLPDGSIDKSFGKEGKAFVTFGGDNGSSVIKLFVKKDQKILLTGRTGVTIFGGDIPVDFAMAQLLPGGTPDSSFGIDGKVSTDLNNQFNDNVTGAVMQKDGKVVITGTSYIYYPVYKSYYALGRYNTAEDKAHRPLIAKIKRFLHNHGIGWKGENSNVAYYSVEKSTGTAGFKEITRVSKNSTQDYHYIIPSNHSINTTSSTEYYRIREVSTTERSTYSNVVAVSPQLSAISIYPNPVKGILTINNLDASSTSKITIADVSGTVWLSAISRQQSMAKYDVSKLKGGTYVLTVTNGTTSNDIKFVKE